jgi:glycosyltransferase involved in cell wall biosynthesis
MAKSKIFINPMRLGSGMRRKILEAWAMGIPVISSTAGCEGLEALDMKNILIADTPKQFAEAVNKLLGNEALRSQIGKEGRRTAEDKHDRRKTAFFLENIYAEITK